MKKEKFFTAQSSSFIEQGLEHMLRAKEAYGKNRARQPIAELENFNAPGGISLDKFWIFCYYKTENSSLKFTTFNKKLGKIRTYALKQFHSSMPPDVK